MSDEIDRLVEAARLLGSTQAKKAHGTYGPADARIERAWYEAIYSHSRNLQARIAELEAALAEAQKDARRMDWIIRKAGYGIDERQCAILRIPLLIPAPDHMGGMRAAIDAAMEGER